MVNYLGYASAASEQDPLLQAVRGYGTGQAILGQQARTSLLMQEAEKEKLRQEALRGYGQTGDMGALMKADPEAGMKMTAQQLQIANAAADYWDNTKAGLTRETYPAWQQETIKKFPGVPATQFPPPETFKTDQDFETWKYQKEMMAAKFKAMVESRPVPMVSPTGQPMGMVTKDTKIAPMGAMPTTLLSNTGQPVGQVQGPIHVMPQGHAPQWFENPDNPKQGTWVKPGETPPAGFVPKSQVIGMAKETEKKEDKQVLAQMLVDAEMSPKSLSKRGDYNTILAQAKKIDPNFNPGKLELKWYGAQRWLSSLSSPQQARMEISGQRVIHTIAEMKRLSSEMNLSGFHPLNYAELESKIKMAGNTPQGQLATQYVTAANDLKELMATAAAGGYAPTESAWKLANQQVNTNFGIKQMHASLDELDRLMKINVNAGKEMREQAGLSGLGQQTPSGGGAGKGVAKDAHYTTFKQALSGPNAKAAIDYATKNDPDFINRAKQEGLIP